MHPAPREGSFDLLAERVLRAVEQIPSGSVVSYGDLAGIVGTTARVVGSVMSQFGSDVTWWRVVSRDGRLPEHLMVAARERWAEEGIAAGEHGCRIDDHRADLDDLAERYAAAVDSLE